jgi:hypothetical protein
VADQFKFNIKPMPDSSLEEIRTRVTDGIALGGNYDQLFSRYVETVNDRRALMKIIDSQSNTGTDHAD